jgi:uncharacterized protein
MSNSQTTLGAGYYPGRAAIDAYGNGGFRFAGMSHRGSILALPSGVWAWDAHPHPSTEQLQPALFARVFSEPRSDLRMLLLGTGAAQVFPSADVRRAFAEAGVSLEVMTTGAACRTYNVLLAEGRPVGSALIAVD